MRRASPWGETGRRLFDERGSAALEFLVAGLILLVPLVYLVVAVGQVQGHALGADAIARHLSHVLARAEPGAETDERAFRLVEALSADYDIDDAALAVDVVCAPDGPACPQAGATMTVTVVAHVPLPLVPPVLGLDDVTSVPVEATAVQKVSRFQDAG